MKKDIVTKKRLYVVKVYVVNVKGFFSLLPIAYINTSVNVTPLNF